MPRRKEVVKAVDDLHRRTLSNMPRPLDRLIYLASTRDYNTGTYYHEGLASRFTEEVACEALADCHGEAFGELVSSSLQDLVGQLEGYRDSTHSSPGEFISAWRNLEPYRVAVPVETDPLAAELLFSNIKIALAILETRRKVRPVAGPAASPRPSLDR
jgi:hypothetical protein